MKKNTVQSLVLVLLCGCAHVTEGDHGEQIPSEMIAEITCKPQFDLKERQDIHVVDAEGNDRTSFWQWLILDDGKQKFRIPWGSPPLSRGSVTLYTHQTYTFTVKTEIEMGTPVQTVARVIKGKEVVYDGTKKLNASNSTEAGDGK